MNSFKIKFCTHFLYCTICSVFCGIILFPSCDDKFEDPSCDILYFTAYVDTLSPCVQSRGGVISDSLFCMVAALEGGTGKTLYLHTEYTDGIPSFSFCQ